MAITRNNLFWLFLGTMFGNLGNAWFVPIVLFGWNIDWSIVGMLGFVLLWNLTRYVRWQAGVFRKKLIQWIRNELRNELDK